MRKWLVIVTISLICGEGVTRVVESARLKYPLGILTDLIVTRRDYWTLRPGAAITQVERSGDVDYIVNAEGYRGPLPNHKTRKRIVFLGDSVTFGLGVDDEETFVRRVEAHLRRASDPVETANLALFSYGPHEYLSTWRRLGRTLSPNLVVLQLYMNDFGAKPWDQPVPIGVGVRLSVLASRLVNVSALARRTQQVAQMAFFYWVRPLRRSLYAQSLNDSEPRDVLALLRASRDFDEIEAIPEIHTLLREIRADGTPVLLIYSPHETQLFKKDFDDINAAVERALANEADYYIDPLSKLRKSPDVPHIFRDGLHYDRRGHALMAEIISGPIEELLIKASRR
jgi:lysophospholipase L1-like esterase